MTQKTTPTTGPERQAYLKSAASKIERWGERLADLQREVAEGTREKSRELRDSVERLGRERSALEARLRKASDTASDHWGDVEKELRGAISSFEEGARAVVEAVRK